jgi:hypothetical protein
MEGGKSSAGRLQHCTASIALQGGIFGISTFALLEGAFSSSGLRSSVLVFSYICPLKSFEPRTLCRVFDIEYSIWSMLIFKLFPMLIFKLFLMSV